MEFKMCPDLQIYQFCNRYDRLLELHQVYLNTLKPIITTMGLVTGIAVLNTFYV